MEATYHCRLVAGMDSKAYTLHLSDSYRRAVNALEIAGRYHEMFICYDELDLDFILEEIKQEVCEQYLRRLFGDSSEEDTSKYLEFTKIYLETNGSQSKMSEQLYLHPNTIKYKSRNAEKLPEWIYELQTESMYLPWQLSYGKISKDTIRSNWIDTMGKL